MSDVRLSLEVVGLDKVKDAADTMARFGKLVGEASGDFRLTGAQMLRYVKAVNTLERETKKLTKAEELNIIKTHEKDAALAELEKRLQKEILLDKELIKTSKEAIKRQKKEADEVANTAAKYDTANRVRAQFFSELAKLDKAHDANAISAEVHAQAVDRLEKELKQFHSGLANGANQFARYNMQAYKTAQTFKRRFNTGVQQAGYQLGDFAVQVQSGQSALVALGQQGSQLAGLLGPYGALGGAVLAIGTALVLAAQQSGYFGDEMKRLEKVFKDFSKEVANIQKLESVLTSTLVTPFHEGTKAVEAYFKALAEASEEKAGKTIASALGTGGTESWVGRLKVLFGGDPRTGLLGRMQRELEEIQAGEFAGPRVRGGRIVDESLVKSYEEAIDKLSFAIYSEKDTLRPLEEIIENLLKLREEYSDEKVFTKYIDQIFEAEEGLRDIAAAIVEERAEEERQRAAAAQKAFEDLQRWNEYRHRGQDAYFQNLYAENDKVAAADKKALIKFHNDKYKADKKAHDLELKRAVEIYEARKKYEEMLAKLRDKLRDERVYSGRGGDPRRMGDQYTREFGYKSPEELIAEFNKKNKPKEDKRQTMESIVTGLIKRAELERNIVKLSEERAFYEKVLYDLELKNAKARDSYTPKELQDAAEKLAAIEKETRELERQQEMYENVADAFGEMLVSVVDGTTKIEDAFKKMALAIVKDLYDIYVVKQITGFITGSLDNVGTMWSDLGKVGAPTMDGGGYTGNGPRSGGLDGKGGFMAMLHPQETVIDHTKGGGAGVVVNQTINVSTGVQQTVRAEVMGLMPQIAAASKGAVLDAKRRGGAYAGAF